MKILLISDSFLPSLGGVERHVYTLIQYLSKKNIDVSLLTSTPSKGEKIDLDKNITISRELKLLNRSHALEWPYTYIHNSTVIKKAIEQYEDKYDLIHYHGTHMLHFNQIKRKKPLISTLHGIFPSCIAFWGIENWCGDTPSAYRCAQCAIKIRKNYSPLLPAMTLYNKYYYNNMEKSLKMTDKVIAVSNYVKNIVKKTFKLNNIDTVYNFIDIKNDIIFNMNKSQKKNNMFNKNNSKIILFSGRVDKQKGITTLLDSLKIINKTHNVILAISGTGELLNYVQKIKKEYNNIIILGYLSRTEQLNLLNECDVFVAPSNYPDACPTTIIEAMALGKPVVATDIGGIPELVKENENGFLVKPNRPELLAEKIIKVLDIGKEQYYDNCTARAKYFDIETQGAQLIEKYKETINAGINL